MSVMNDNFFGLNDNIEIEKTATVLKCGTNSNLVHLVNSTGAATGVTLAIYPLGNGWRAVFTLTAVEITHVNTDGTGSAGSVKLGEFLDTANSTLIITGGAILLDTVSAAAGGNASMVVHWGVGTVAADVANGALTGTEDDIVASAAAAALSSGAGTDVTNISVVGNAVVLATANDIYLNESGTDATSGANDTITVSGKVIVDFFPGLE